MNFNIRWGSLEPLANDRRIVEVVEKQKSKLLKEIKDESASSVTISFEIDNSTKEFITNITVVVPKDKIRVQKSGYTLEESITEAVNHVRYTLRKNKDKVITISRKSSLKSFLF
jgi:ribosome-associated translation inhibitor RaiA